VLFGDHLPALSPLYRHIGLTNTDERAYLTPYFIWANYELPVQHRRLSAAELGAYALSRLGIPMTPLHKLQLMCMMDPDDAALDEDLRLLLYDCEYGQQYYYQLYGYALDNPDYLIGRPIEVTGARVGQVGGNHVLMLEGRHFTWKSAIRAGGRQHALTAIDGRHAYLRLSDELAQTLIASDATFEAIDNRGHVVQTSAPFEIMALDQPPDDIWSALLITPGN